MITKLPYGIRNGKLISISAVKKGLACDCICPSCKGRLVAKKGEFKIHHFAHYKTNDCPGGIETALHLAAKAILEKEKELLIPPLEVSLPNISEEKVILSKSRRITFEEITLEVILEDIKPDVIINIGEKKLLVEIAVTHFVDDSKFEKIKTLGISTIEIDLSSLMDGFTNEDLKQLVINSIDNKKWIYNNREKELREKYIEKWNQLLAEANTIYTDFIIPEDLITDVKVAIRKGFQIISTGDGGIARCPKTVILNARNCKDNQIIDQLKNGKYWDGKIHGKIPNDQYIFINGKKNIILPNSKNNKIDDEEMGKFRNIFNQLLSLRVRSGIRFSDCESCKYFKKYTNKDLSSIACSYRKDNNLK